MNNRIKQLRELKKLNQVDFGNMLGMTRHELSNLESGRTKIKESDIKLIIYTFKVNETWLREGKGEIFKEEYKIDKKISEITNLLTELSTDFQDCAVNRVRELVILNEINKNEKCCELVNLFMKLTPTFQDYAMQQVRELSNLQSSFVKDTKNK
ncbi:helix-turn-helix transcriptional regulator [Clostridioides difficile]|nr:helix-turn-helix transcriptional regulator [Clostridioides difficile]